jgi:two-component system, OmpR family, response regulator CpxR
MAAQAQILHFCGLRQKTGRLLVATILIIDDDCSPTLDLLELLREEGHDVVCASTLVDAMPHLRHDELDLVMIDIGMSEQTGMQILEALCEEPRYAGLRVAVYSESADDNAIAHALHIGACAFIDKRLQWEALYDRIRKHLPAETQPA